MGTAFAARSGNSGGVKAVGGRGGGRVPAAAYATRETIVARDERVALADRVARPLDDRSAGGGRHAVDVDADDLRVFFGYYSSPNHILPRYPAASGRD